MKRKILLPAFALLILAAFFLGTSEVLRLRKDPEPTGQEERPQEDLVVGILLLPEWPDWTVYNAGKPSQDYEEREALFSELNGIPYFWGVCGADEKMEAFTWCVVGAGISDADFHYGADRDDTAESVAERLPGIGADDPEGENLTVTNALYGTIYVRRDVDREWAMHGIPIYQKSTGEIYASTEGEIDHRFVPREMSYSIWGKKKEIEEGERTLISKVKLSCKTINHPGKSIRLLQMDENHEILAEQSYEVTEMPEEFEPMPEAAYLLVEADETDSEGTALVHRTLCQRGDESFSYFIGTDNGVCIKKSCYLKYGE